ncbi:enolase C-terminal domain-like protein [Candidatus Latescibacterota bacterium]
MKRRDVMKGIALGAAAGAAGMFTNHDEAAAQRYSGATKGLPPLKITNIKCIPTAPNGIRLNVVKVETSEPGLYGLGCATFQQRPLPVVVAVNNYLADFCRGKDADNIEDMWQTMYVNSSWRNGPVLNNAISGVDQALWDIKGKRAGMPVYQLLGGKCRFAVPLYAHAGGRDVQQLEDRVKRFMEEKYQYIRIQVGGYGSPHLSNQPHFKDAGFGVKTDGLNNPGPAVRVLPPMFEHIRNTCGEEIELLHDIHERIPPIMAINVVKELEQYHPFFIEDPFAPEDVDYFRLMRQQTCTPIAMGELFNNPHEWVDLISERLIDFIRVHISAIGGITPAIKIARLCEWFNVRSAYHGPGDVCPVGHAANLHIDLAIWNFGIQERTVFGEETREVFPGSPTIKDGYFYVNEAPGLGVDLDEKLAAKFPISDNYMYNNWTQIRKSDGTAVRP